uniref:Uncharacterized protein n=1 Tax=Ascaris lumbricoides TaxID=6252 RepID=A0A0M3IEQ3_ASCLU
MLRDDVSVVQVSPATSKCGRRNWHSLNDTVSRPSDGSSSAKRKPGFKYDQPYRIPLSLVLRRRSSDDGFHRRRLQVEYLEFTASIV